MGRRKKKIISVVDVETNPQGNLVLIGFYDGRNYRPFKYGNFFFSYIKEKGIKEIWCHNLEFDFFQIFESFPEVKVYGINNSGGIAYIQNGNIYWKDTINYLPLSLKDIGELIGIEKQEPDYEKIEKVTDELIQCNKNHCVITYKVVKVIQKICRAEKIYRIPSTSGALAFDIWKKNYNGMKLKKILDVDLKNWRMGYKGGYVKVFKTGEYRDKEFYKIDVNSLFPFCMLNTYPYPYKFKVTKKLKDSDNKKFILGINERQECCYNSLEHNLKTVKCDYYYIFPFECYPFKRYVESLYPKKLKGSLIERKIYKRLLTGLYGKFAQRSGLDVITTNKNLKNYSFLMQVSKNLYRVKVETKNKYWVNVAWSLFTTAYSRVFIKKMIEFVKGQGLEVYSVDTDGIIISGDIKRISRIIDNEKIGFFKIEDMSNSIDIKGKKLYRFGDEYKVKGVPKKYQEEFFKNDYVQFKKMVRLKESFREGLKFGSWKDTEKSNIMNKPLTNV